MALMYNPNTSPSMMRIAILNSASLQYQLRDANTEEEREGVLRSFTALRGSIIATTPVPTEVERWGSNSNRKADGEMGKVGKMGREIGGRGFDGRAETTNKSSATTRIRLSSSGGEEIKREGYGGTKKTTKKMTTTTKTKRTTTKTTTATAMIEG